MQTSVDAFLDGKFMLEQPLKGQRAGMDAMLLAAIVPVGGDAEELVLEAGTGSGPVALSLASRFDRVKVTAIERQAEIAALAEKNMARNGLQERVKIIEADVTAPLSRLEPLGLVANQFDHVAANPPFYDTARSRPSPSDEKSQAHRLEQDELPRWIKFLTSMAKPKGSLSLIHRPDSLPELLALLSGRFGGLRIAPVFARPGEAAVRVLLHGTKGSRAPMRLLPGLVLRDGDNRATALADAIFRHGESWQL